MAVEQGGDVLRCFEADPTEGDLGRLLGAPAPVAARLGAVREALNGPILAIRGNHDVDWLADLRVPAGERTAPIDPHDLFRFVPDATVLSFGRLRIGFLGWRGGGSGSGWHRSRGVRPAARTGSGCGGRADHPPGSIRVHAGPWWRGLRLAAHLGTGGDTPSRLPRRRARPRPLGTPSAWSDGICGTRRRRSDAHQRSAATRIASRMHGVFGYGPRRCRRTHCTLAVRLPRTVRVH